ncbi:hypothetical protein KY290_030882 [Solanum tuberosum]|uniref:Uncharacterized protein n=1 Tax=Solanum tuberosum TaxID=4113 RepID=A0ABQ7U8G2_SOLTU|nr:hypothetical protein KY289_030120 [Solanum tuberosum]KAH0742889.1 hypothetical protein KY290_030882 [Solanum tuberosum]
MDSKISSTKLACIVAYLLFACFFQLLTANEEVKLNDEFKVIQLPGANSEALDGVFQVFVTRYDRQHVGSKKIGVCIDPPPCGSDSECANSGCGHRCLRDGWGFRVCHI